MLIIKFVNFLNLPENKTQGREPWLAMALGLEQAISYLLEALDITTQ